MDDRSKNVMHQLTRHTVHTVIKFCENEIPWDDANKTAHSLYTVQCSNNF